MPTHRFISSQSDQYHNQTRFGPLDNAHMYICSMQLATPLLPFLAKRPITHILYDFCAISFSTTRTITYVLYMPQLDHSQKCPVPYSETQCAAKPRHCTLHECRGSQILAQTSIGQNLDVALPEHVARFYVTSRNKIGERPRAKMRGQRCGKRKVRRSGPGPPSSDHEQAMSSRFPVAHCCAICAPDACVSVESQLLPAGVSLVPCKRITPPRRRRRPRAPPPSPLIHQVQRLQGTNVGCREEL
jgi:hypothetical protein